MSELVIPLTAFSEDARAQVGTKAAALAELQRAGLNVPKGFVLTTAAYPEFLAPLRDKIRAQLTEDVIMDPAALEGAATDIRAEIQAQPFPQTLRAALSNALEAFGEAERASLIARTSTPSDDLATSFGSGVARAYLGLTNLDEIERAAAKCWAALWNSRSMYYRQRKKIIQTDVALAVLIQPIVRADSAGVLFTHDPMQSSSNEMQVSSIWGLGAPLTSARFRPDQFMIDRTSGQITDRTIEEQVVKLVVGADGHIEERAVANDKIEAPSLTDVQVQELAALGKRIEDFFKAPQDIEWAIAGNEIFILQARPIGIRTS